MARGIATKSPLSEEASREFNSHVIHGSVPFGIIGTTTFLSREEEADSVSPVNSKFTQRKGKQIASQTDSIGGGMLHCRFLAEKILVTDLAQFLEIETRSHGVPAFHSGDPTGGGIPANRNAWVTMERHFIRKRGIASPLIIDSNLNCPLISTKPTNRETCIRRHRLDVHMSEGMGNHVHLVTISGLDIFVFDFGCICFWGASREEVRFICEFMSPYLVEPTTDTPEVCEDIPYVDVSYSGSTEPDQQDETTDPGVSLGESVRNTHSEQFHDPKSDETTRRSIGKCKNHGVVSSSRLDKQRSFGQYCRHRPLQHSRTILNDEIHLSGTNSLNKLAYSFAFAQSVKLETFECRASQVINSSRHIPHNLKKTGKIGLNNKQITMQIGDLFSQRCEINLHWDLLGTPDVFWEKSSVEDIYEECREYLDIDKRIQILNQRLDVMRDMYELIQGELNVQQGEKLEWIIIILILAEVFLQLIDMIWFK